MNRFLLAFSYNNTNQYDIGSTLLNLDGTNGTFGDFSEIISQVANNFTIIGATTYQGTPINDITPSLKMSGSNVVLVWTSDVNGRFSTCNH